MQHLIPNSTLQSGKYKIIKVLGQGGFGITYLAIQSGLERKVAVKEFFMKELCERDESTSHVTLGTAGSRETVVRFREKFLKEARNIAKLNHTNIVRIIDVFEENGTAYYVMEYAENGSLADRLKRETYLSEPVATRYILQVASALEYIHQQKMNHLDVKPSNIMLNEKDEAILIDFGLSKQYDATTGKQTSTTPVGASEGYAPMEQYRQGGVGEFSPETDIYALGATFFKLLTGITPPGASDINEYGIPVDELEAKGVSRNSIYVICKAMEVRKKDRMKNVHTFINGLNGDVSAFVHPNACNYINEITNLTTDSLTKEEHNIHKEIECNANTYEGQKAIASKSSSYKMWMFVVGIIIIIGTLFAFYVDWEKEQQQDIEGTIHGRTQFDADSIRIVNTQTPDLSFYEVHGPVKKIAIIKHDNYNIEEICEYDEEGNLTSIDGIDPAIGADEGGSYRKYSRDREGKIKSISSLGGTVYYEWKDGRVYKYFSQYEEGGKNETIFTFDKDGRLCETFECEYEYDYEKNKLVPYETKTLHYTYISKDKYGNWTKRKCEDYYETRTITYYSIKG